MKTTWSNHIRLGKKQRGLLASHLCEKTQTEQNNTESKRNKAGQGNKRSSSSLFYYHPGHSLFSLCVWKKSLSL
jgi:hypothetical protein